LISPGSSHKRRDTVSEVGCAGPGGYAVAGPPRRRSAMSLKPHPDRARARGDGARRQGRLPQGNPLLSLRDELSAIFVDADFADLCRADLTAAALHGTVLADIDLSSCKGFGSCHSTDTLQARLTACH
jgi:hypothetical protein